MTIAYKSVDVLAISVTYTIYIAPPSFTKHLELKQKHGTVPGLHLETEPFFKCQCVDTTPMLFRQCCSTPMLFFGLTFCQSLTTLVWLAVQRSVMTDIRLLKVSVETLGPNVISLT